MFTVIWSHLAFELMDAILQANPERRSTLAKSLRWISQELHVDPMGVGESRDENRRVWFLNDLVVHFDVDLEDHTVEIAIVNLID